MYDLALIREFCCERTQSLLPDNRAVNLATRRRKGEPTMLQVDEARTRELLDWMPLVEKIRAMFQADCDMPVRPEPFLQVPGAAKAKRLPQPAWTWRIHD